MSATCELLLKSGAVCDVVAVSRCVDCERAICVSHALPGQFGAILAQCVACKAEDDLAEAQKRDDAIVRSKAAMSRISQIAAELRNFGSPGLETKRVITGVRKRLFGKRVEEFRTVGVGWPVGRHSWGVKQYTDGDDWFQNWRDFDTAVLPDGSLAVFESFNNELLTGFSGDPEEVVAVLIRIAGTHGVRL